MISAVLRYLRRVKARVRSRCEGRLRTTYSIAHNPQGIELCWLTIEADRGYASVRWSDVQTAIAFKRDRYIVDLICLEIARSDGTVIELHDEMDGWETLLDKLPEYLPGSKPLSNWFIVVAVPAFATNPTVIFQRQVSVAPNHVLA